MRGTQKNFWNEVPRPCIVAAPMADVTDNAFRTLLSRHGPPDIYWTEFVSADGLSSPEGRQMLEKDLEFEEAQRPIVGQLFTSSPEHMYQASVLLAEKGFDGVDINMGCPDKNIEKQGCGAAMIKDPEKALAIIEAAGKSGLPVSVKTRIGYNSEDIDTWLPTILNSNIETLTVHLRTRKEMSKVPAHWECMSRIISLRDSIAPHIRIIGNGDIYSYAEAESYIASTRCDGIMIGRGMFGNVWVFDKDKKAIGAKEKIEVLVELAKLFEEKVSHKPFHIMKKHIKAFIHGFDGAKELRVALMDQAHTAHAMQKIIEDWLKHSYQPENGIQPIEKP